MLLKIKNYFINMTLKRFVNTVFLTLSISLSGYFLYHISKYSIVRAIALIFAVSYELANKYQLSLARTKIKTFFRVGFKKGWTHLLTALFLLIFYGVYLAYNILSGAGFFITVITVQDKAALKSEVIENQKLIELKQLNETIDSINEALAVEVKTSFRSMSAELEDKLEKLKEERAELLKTTTLNEQGNAVEQNPFKNLADVLDVPMNKLVGLVFMMIMAGICVTLIVTSEDLPDDETNTDISKHEPPEVKTSSLSQDVTQNDIEILKPESKMPELYELRTNPDNINNVTPGQQDIIKFIEQLWGDNQEEIPKELTALKNIGVTDRKTRKYSDYLESIGAIEKGRGVPPRAMWEKQKVIDYIKAHDIAI